MGTFFTSTFPVFMSYFFSYLVALVRTYSKMLTGSYNDRYPPLVPPPTIEESIYTVFHH
jgi:hypothetical protein